MWESSSTALGRHLRAGVHESDAIILQRKGTFTAEHDHGLLVANVALHVALSGLVSSQQQVSH
jgi:hypothetical protein